MKDKIEFNKDDLINLLVEKVNFLSNEYLSLLDAFQYDMKRGKTNTDPIKITDSHKKFLKEFGDIRRILNMYEMFNEKSDTINYKKTTNNNNKNS